MTQLTSLHIEYVDPRSLLLLDVNARFMPRPRYQRLVDNIKQDGALTSVPLAVRQDDGRYLVRSGNHRVMASIDAGLEQIPVMLCDDPLTDARQLALQLSHNSLAGEDDPAILKEIYESIDDVDWRIYAGLDDKELELLAKVSPVSINEAGLEFSTITLAFLPSEVDEVAAAFDQAREFIAAGETWLVSMADYDAALDALAVVGETHGIKNQALGMRLLVRLAEDHFTDLTDAWWDEHKGEKRHPKWVPVHALVGVGELPPDSARIVERAVRKAIDNGDVTAKDRWRALEQWASAYLDGE